MLFSIGNAFSRGISVGPSGTPYKYLRNLYCSGPSTGNVGFVGISVPLRRNLYAKGRDSGAYPARGSGINAVTEGRANSSELRCGPKMDSISGPQPAHTVVPSNPS